MADVAELCAAHKNHFDVGKVTQRQNQTDDDDNEDDVCICMSSVEHHHQCAAVFLQTTRNFLLSERPNRM